MLLSFGHPSLGEMRATVDVDLTETLLQHERKVVKAPEEAGLPWLLVLSPKNTPSLD